MSKGTEIPKATSLPELAPNNPSWAVVPILAIEQSWLEGERCFLRQSIRRPNST